MTLFVLCFIAWWAGRKTVPKSAYCMLVYISCLFVSGSVGNGAQMHLLELAYVDDRNYPGGPGAYETFNGSVASSVISTAAYMVNAWFADGLLVRTKKIHCPS